MRSLAVTLLTDESGLTTVEYALLLALVSLVAVGTWGDLGCEVARVARTATGHLPQS
jgi:Flp pilus assembly pilin Flp